MIHNPRADKRTTLGSFHVVDYGLPVPADKYAVPPVVFCNMLKAALSPPTDLAVLPFTKEFNDPATYLMSMLLRPIVVPEVPGVQEKKTMEIRVFGPGGCASNLAYLEQIFGNAGDPFYYENDAALDVQHWTGHTGCIIVAPHLVHCNKKDLGCPHYDDATPYQRSIGMCWKSEDEKYNGGKAFKLVCRDPSGVIFTLIADNYFGYSKKEVKV